MTIASTRHELAQQVGNVYATTLLRAGFRTPGLNIVNAQRAATLAQRASQILEQQEQLIREADATGKLRADNALRAIRMAVEAGCLRSQCDAIAGTGASLFLGHEPLMPPTVLAMRISLATEAPLSIRLVTTQEVGADGDPHVTAKASIYLKDGSRTQGPDSKELREHLTVDVAALKKWAEDLAQAVYKEHKQLLVGTLEILPNQEYRKTDDLLKSFVSAPIVAPDAPRKQPSTMSMSGG